MSTLRRQESIGQGLKRIACTHVESAIRCLTRQAGQAVAAADEIDRALAVLSLIEPELPRHAVRKEHAILARLTAALAEMTEPTRLLEQLDSQYKKTSADSDLATAVKSLRKRWSSQDQTPAVLSSRAGSFNPVIYRLVADMAELRGHMDHWPVKDVADDGLPRGLRRTYTKARRLVHEPVTEDTLKELVGVLNELVTQLSVISKACPPMLKAQRKMVQRGTDALSGMLYCELLDVTLRAELSKGSAKALPDAKPLAERVADLVQKEIEPALAESPAAFIKRAQAYWSAWRSDASA